MSGAIHGFLPVRSRVCPTWKTAWSGWTVTYCTFGVIAPCTVTVPEPATVAELAPTRNW